MNTHYQCNSPGTSKNPVLNPDISWSETDIKCNHCGGDCEIAPEEKSPNGSRTQLVHCLNRFHCKGEYGFVHFIDDSFGDAE